MQLERRRNNVDGNQSINQMLAIHKEQELEIQNMDFQNLSDHDKQVLAEYAETKVLLHNTANVIQFVQNSAQVITDENGQKQAVGMLDKESYVELSVFATMNQNPELLEMAKQSQITELPLSEKAALWEKGENTQQEILLHTPATVDNFVEAGYDSFYVGDGTVEVLDATLADAMELMKDYGIDQSDVYNSTQEQFRLMQEQQSLVNYEYTEKEQELSEENEYLQRQMELQEIAKQAVEENYSKDDKDGLQERFSLTTEEVAAVVVAMQTYEWIKLAEAWEQENLAEKTKEQEPAEIVESSDGYVMAMSKMTPQNEKQLQSRIENGNEVIHHETARETTTDPAQVKPNVKLETAQNKGTQEKKARQVDYDRD